MQIREILIAGSTLPLTFVKRFQAARELRRDIEAYVGEKHSDERRHRYLEEMFWRKSGALAIATFLFTIIGSILACLVYFQTKRQADISEANLTASTRPWIEIVDIKVLSYDFVFTDLLVGTSVSLRNIGHSPAFNISLRGSISLNPQKGPGQCSKSANEAALYIPDPKKYISVPTKTFIATASNSSVIFPEETRNAIPLIADMPSEAILQSKLAKKAVETELDAQASFNFNPFRESFIPPMKKSSNVPSDEDRFSVPSRYYLGGCVFYSFAQEINADHFTSFLFEIIDNANITVFADMNKVADENMSPTAEAYQSQKIFPVTAVIRPINAALSVN